LDRCTEGVVLKPCVHPCSPPLDPAQQSASIDPLGAEGLLQSVEDQLVEAPAALICGLAQSLVQILRHVLQRNIHNGTIIAPYRCRATFRCVSASEQEQASGIECNGADERAARPYLWKSRRTARSGSRLVQGATHDIQGRGAVEPDFEGECALMEEERQSVGGAGAGVFGVFEEAGDGRAVNHVIDHEVGGEDGGGDEARVGALHAEGCGIDDQVGAGELLAQGGFLQRDDGDGILGSFEAVGVEQFRDSPGDVVRFVFGPVDEDEARAFFQRALQGGGRTGATAGAEDHDAEVAEVEGEDFPDGANEARSVGVEAGGPGAVEEQGVDRAELAGGVVEFGAEFEGFEFVGNGEVESEKVRAAGRFDRFGQVLGRAFDFGVADGGTEGLQGRVVHDGRERVFDRGTEDGETDLGRDRAAAPGAGFEVREGEGGLSEVGHGTKLSHERGGWEGIFAEADDPAGSDGLPVFKGGGLPEVVPGIVEEIEDGGVADAEAAAGFADADAGVILDEALPSDFVEQAAAFVPVHRFGAGAGGSADEFVPRITEKPEGGAVGVVEEVVRTDGTECGEHGTRRLEQGLRGTRGIMKVDKVAAEEPTVVAENELRGVGGIHERIASTRRKAKVVCTPSSSRLVSS